MTPRKRRSRLGLKGYARILVRLHTGRATLQDLAEEGLAQGHTSGRMFIACMHHFARVHIAGWEEPPGRRLRPQWRYGYAPDVPPPTQRANGRPPQSVYLPPLPDPILPAVIAMDDLLTRLEMPITVAQLVDETGLARETIYEALAALRPIVKSVGHSNQSVLWQLRAFAVEKPSALFDADQTRFRSAPSVFMLAA